MPIAMAMVDANIGQMLYLLYDSTHDRRHLASAAQILEISARELERLGALRAVYDQLRTLADTQRELGRLSRRGDLACRAVALRLKSDTIRRQLELFSLDFSDPIGSDLGVLYRTQGRAATVACARRMGFDTVVVQAFLDSLANGLLKR
jgi:hypothetical protein